MAVSRLFPAGFPILPAPSNGLCSCGGVYFDRHVFVSGFLGPALPEGLAEGPNGQVPSNMEDFEPVPIPIRGIIDGKGADAGPPRVGVGSLGFYKFWMFLVVFLRFPVAFPTLPTQ